MYLQFPAKKGPLPGFAIGKGPFCEEPFISSGGLPPLAAGLI
ncbi:hypothetical protein [uncultured Oscillibacter sp.]|nr:hypothetical protein [uncultured Oscillibacter sp.]